MGDARRHSVDLPISKALSALRRVKSLRDPTTTSLSKFHASAAGATWETTWKDVISHKFTNGFPGFDNSSHHSSGTDCYGERNRCVSERREARKSSGSGKPARKKVISISTNEGQGLGHYLRSDVREKCRNKSSSERYGAEYEDKGWDSTCITLPDNRFEDVGSCDETIGGGLEVGRTEHTSPKQRLKPKSNRSEVSHVVRPWQPSDALQENLSSSSSLYEDECAHDDPDHCGCAIRSDWPKTPACREESNFLPGRENSPLLSGEVAEMVHSAEIRAWKNIHYETVECSRSLSQKYRPRSFGELVGQSVVARSLSSAVNSGRVTSFYIFHGSRGTGKTSASRIFAAALNCLSMEEQRPCGLCQECVLFFSGRSTDVWEVDTVRINGIGGARTLLKNAVTPSVSSSYRVLIFDECQLLDGETWATVLSSLEGLPQHVILVMITADLDKLPRSAVSRSQKYHFPRIKDADVAWRLENICIEEGLHFDPDALNFIAAKASGSLRDAEMMLEQLSLLGKRITISLAHELVGVVSDDELLDLLDLALSSDTKSTVTMARELMKSRIDPLQLLSQLANLIMDLLAEKCNDGASEVRQRFSRRTNCEADLQKLSNALKVLSEAEKQLRTSKNQTTWLTVALLQLSSVESSLDTNGSGLCLGTTGQRGKSLEHLEAVAHGPSISPKTGPQGNYSEALESMWRRATETCRPKSLMKFLRKHGRLSSVCTNQGLTIVELEFHHPDHIARANKSWKVIASSFNSVLNCNVEIKINLVPLAPMSKFAKVKKLSFSLFGCSGRRRSPTISCPSEYSDMASEKSMIRDKPMATVPKEVDCDNRCQASSTQKVGSQPNYYSGSMWPGRWSSSSNNAETLVGPGQVARFASPSNYINCSAGEHG